MRSREQRPRELRPRGRPRPHGRRARRAARATAPVGAAIALAAALAAALAGCDPGVDPPPPPVEVRMFVDANVPTGAREGPALVPTQVLVSASGPDGKPPRSVVIPVRALVANGAHVASGELVVERRAAAERWRLRAAAAVGADTLFRVVEDVLLRVDSPRPGVPLVLIYGGRDARLQRVEILPRDTTVAVGRTFRPLVTAIDYLGDRLVPAVGWRSRDSTVAVGDGAGSVTAVAPGTAWIVVRSWSGVADSMRVTVR